MHVQIANNVLVDNQDFLLHEGERVGLVGRNGAGKSTLLRILAGQEHFFTGSINCRKNLRSAFLAQEVDLRPELTVGENILSGAAGTMALLQEYEHGATGKHLEELEREIAVRDGWNLEARMRELQSSLAAPALERLAGELSGGEKRRVALCRTLMDLPELLILDEPTNHLDTDSIEWLENYLRRYQGTCLYVTHDRYFLDRTCTRIVELSQGRLYSYPGSYSDFLRQKAEHILEAESQEEKRLAFIRREIDWVRRGPKARGTKSKSRLQRYEDAVNAGPLQRDGDVELLIPPAEKLGNIVVTLDHVTLSRNERVLFRDLCLEFQPGMRLGIIGRNGLGKTSFLKMILGELTPDSGSLKIGDRTQINYADQHRVSLDDSKTVYEDIGEGNDFVLFADRKISIWTYLKRFLFQDDEINTLVGQLSGGERNRLVLAKILKRGGNFLMLDEPTNDLDLATLRVMEEALTNFSGCVIVVSHDRYFLNRVCTDILAFEDAGKVVYQPGNYSYYEQKRAEAGALTAPPAPSTTPPQPAPLSPAGNIERRRNKLTWAEKRELEGIESAILAAEQRAAEIEALFMQPDFHSQHGRELPELTDRLAQAKAELERLYARWSELEERNTAV
ncbi:MAG: ATP-binding cassette domain-containing protein [Oligosphaeraceae bacterium]|nr:ATP-binding cassette domain-containing protein [Oligosphaeraceae bacterium]